LSIVYVLLFIVIPFYWLLAFGPWQLYQKFEVFIIREAANSQRPKARG